MCHDDAGVEIAGQVALGDAFDGCLGANRHEHGCFDDAVRSVNQSGARACMGTLGLKLEAHLLNVTNVSGRPDSESNACGADPLVRAGPPGPALYQGDQSHTTARRPTRASAADQRVRPTVNSD